jgi:hypothetical protein
MVRNDTDQRKTIPAADVPAGTRTRSSPDKQDNSVDVLARVDADFARIFGAR